MSREGLFLQYPKQRHDKSFSLGVVWCETSTIVQFRHARGLRKEYSVRFSLAQCTVHMARPTGTLLGKVKRVGQRIPVHRKSLAQDTWLTMLREASGANSIPPGVDRRVEMMMIRNIGEGG